MFKWTPLSPRGRVSLRTPVFLVQHQHWDPPAVVELCVKPQDTMTHSQHFCSLKKCLMLTWKGDEHPRFHLKKYYFKYVQWSIYIWNNSIGIWRGFGGVIEWHSVYIYIYLYVYTHIYTHTYIYICIHTYLHTYIYICIYLYIYVYTHIYTRAYIYVYICIHTYLHTYILVLWKIKR